MENWNWLTERKQLRKKARFIIIINFSFVSGFSADMDSMFLNPSTTIYINHQA
jgi:hypothetical protein